MKKTNQLELVVNNFRAISTAKIALNGITVVAGENGSGKSTLSKLLYHIIDGSNNYDYMIQYGILLPAITRLLGVIDEMNDVLDYYKRRINKNDLFSTTSIRDVLSSSTLLEDEANIVEYLDYLDNVFAERCSFFDNKGAKGKLNKIVLITKNALDNTEVETVNDCIKLIKSKLAYHFDQSRIKITRRPISVINQGLNNIFQDNSISQNTFGLQEFGVEILDHQDKRVGRIASVHDVTYIYTPFAFDFMDLIDRSMRFRQLNAPRDTQYIADLSGKVKLSAKSDMFLNLSKEISSVIKGKVSYEKQIGKRGFWFHQDGVAEPFKLAECATGIKSFAILQLLLDNNCINENTLLVLDEPETHLHPQWIVEYARMIVMLNKELGVKFFIASHNPDMVNAIYSIAKKESILDGVNYYLAERAGETYQYSYRELGTDIDPIFLSFNIALDRIAQYGI